MGNLGHFLHNLAVFGVAFHVNDRCHRLGKVLRNLKLRQTHGFFMRLHHLQKTRPDMLGAGGMVALDELIHPRCEPEIVFVLAEDLAGPGVVAGDVLDATERVVGGIEIIDSSAGAPTATPGRLFRRPVDASGRPGPSGNLLSL